jgi:hypothetical protein
MCMCLVGILPCVCGRLHTRAPTGKRISSTARSNIRNVVDMGDKEKKIRVGGCMAGWDLCLSSGFV